MADFVLSQADIDEFEDNNASLTIDGEPAEVGSVIPESGNGVKLVATCNPGYEFASAGFSSLDLELFNGNRTQVFTAVTFGNDRKADLTGVNANDDAYFRVNTEANFDYLVTQGDIDFLEAHGLTVTVNDYDELVSGYALEDYDLLEASVKEGFEIVYITSQDADFSPIEWTVQNEGMTAFINYDYTFTDVFTGAEVNQPEAEAIGTNNVYLIDGDILKVVNTERFERIGSGESSQIMDFGQFILGLIYLPTELPAEGVLEPAFIKLAKKELPVKAPELKSDTIFLEMGEIDVPASFGDSRDFMNTLCRLHLPNAPSIVVEPEYIIGQTLSIEYLVDAYTGETSVTLYSTKTGKYAFHMHRVSLGISVPYATSSRQDFTLGNANIDIGGDNKVTTPFVEVVRNESPLAEKFFSVPITDEATLSQQSGYIEVENVELDFQALGDEKRQIENQLASGVIIK